MELHVGTYLLDTDPAATRVLTEAGGDLLERCDCAYCRNFLVAVEGLPEEAKQFFETLGLDIRKPQEAAENGREEDGRRWYTAWYYLPGTIKEGDEDMEVAKDCYCAFQTFCYRRPEDFPKPSFQLTMNVCLPWLLEEQA